jgi:hypothetical protein
VNPESNETVLIISFHMKNNRRVTDLFRLYMVLFFAADAIGQQPVPAFKQASAVMPFALSDVRLIESPFLDAQRTDAKYILALDEDRLLAPFLKDAGLSPLKPNYGNWESQGLDGHIAGVGVPPIQIGLPIVVNKYCWVYIAPMRRYQRFAERIGEVAGGLVRYGHADGHSFCRRIIYAYIPVEFPVPVDALGGPGVFGRPGKCFR